MKSINLQNELKKHLKYGIFDKREGTLFRKFMTFTDAKTHFETLGFADGNYEIKELEGK